MRDARKRVEPDVVFARVTPQQPARPLPKVARALEAGRKSLNRAERRLQQLRHAPVALDLVPLPPAPLDFPEPVMQGLDQQPAALRIVQQIVLQIRIALDHPDIAEHFEQHPRAAPGAPFLAQRFEHAPGSRPQQPDHDFAIRQRGVVVRYLAQAGRGLRGGAGAARRGIGLQRVHQRIDPVDMAGVYPRPASQRDRDGATTARMLRFISERGGASHHSTR